MSRPDRVLRKAVAPVLEQLEQRQMMSVSLDHGELKIIGTYHSDTIVVQWASKAKAELMVTINDQPTIIADPVKSIYIASGRGNDSITVMESAGKITTPMTIYGGRGDDAIISGSGNDTIYGAQGVNQIDAGGGTNTVYDSAAQDAASSGAVMRPMVTIPSYVITDLGTLPNKAGDTWVRNMSNGTSPYTVGYSVVNDASRMKTRHAFRRGLGGTLDLGTFSGGAGGSLSEAWDVDIHGHVVGFSDNGPGTNDRAFYYDGSRLVDIGSLGGGDTVAYGMNYQYSNPIPPWIPPPEPDIVVGVTGANPVTTPTDETRRSGLAFWWAVGRSMQTIDDGGAAGSGGVLRGEAREVNNRYQVVGWNQRTDNAFVEDDFDTNNPVYHDLGSLNGGTSEAFDINDPVSAATLATAVGTSDIGTVNQRAFYWNGGTMQALPKPTGTGIVTWAWGINNDEPTNPTPNGIVGYVENRTGGSATRNAALWFRNGAAYQFINLQALTAGATGRTLLEARAINESGCIVAIGRVPGDANLHSFLLKPGPAGGTMLAPLGFSSTFTAPLPNGGALGSLSYNIYGVGDFTVAKNTVTMSLLSTDLEKGRQPSAGTVDFTFGAPLTRYVVSTRKGTGIFQGRAMAQVTTNDGQFADILVRFEGTTGRSNRRDVISGNFVGISSRGKVLMQGRQPVYQGKLFMRSF